MGPKNPILIIKAPSILSVKGLGVGLFLVHGAVGHAVYSRLTTSKSFFFFLRRLR